SKSRRRSARRSKAPRDASVRGLTEEQLEQVLMLLPGWERKLLPGQIEDRINSIRRSYGALRTLAPELWAGKAERSRAIEQLESLAESAERFLEAVRSLRPLAVISLTGDARSIGFYASGAIEEWLKPSASEDAEILERAAATVSFVDYCARR